MRLAAILATIAVLIGSGVCVRLGLWQLSRWHEKQALNAAIRASERSPEIRVSGEPPAAGVALNRSFRMTGRYDESRQFLLSGVLHEGEPGVEVVTPLRLEGSDRAVLVNRGWLPADDAISARPQDHPEPGEQSVDGVAEPMKQGAGPPGPRALPSDTVALYSLRWLDADSIATHLPYPVAAYVVRQRPGAGLPEPTAPHAASALR